MGAQRSLTCPGSELDVAAGQSGDNAWFARSLANGSFKFFVPSLTGLQDEFKNGTHLTEWL